VILVNNSRVIPGDLKSPDSLGDRSEIREIMTRYPSLLCVVLCAHVHGDGPTTEIPPPLPPSMNVATRWPYPGSTIEYEIHWNHRFALSLRVLYRGLRRHHRRVHALAPRTM
jgi:hypothetical protein